MANIKLYAAAEQSAARNPLFPPFQPGFSDKSTHVGKGACKEDGSAGLGPLDDGTGIVWIVIAVGSMSTFRKHDKLLYMTSRYRLIVQDFCPKMKCSKRVRYNIF